MHRAEQVRQILATRSLTLYRVSRQSAQIFGRSSRFFIPHNLYYDIADPSSIPTIHQMLAFSHITNYRLWDWLTVFGFHLDLIPRLRLLAPVHRTVLLDSSVYDAHAWIPWFAERRPAAPVPPIAPLRQLLTLAAPRRAVNLLALNTRRFLYGKVGAADAHALPHFAPGSIVRVDARRSEELLSGAKAKVENRFFFVEHSFGWTCAQVVVLAKDRVILHSEQRPWWSQSELKLGQDARILGVIDAEIRPISAHRQARIAPSAAPCTPQPLHARDQPDDLKSLLRSSRMRAGLSFREASSVSRWIASMLGDEFFFAATSTLSDYETLSAPPRHIQKTITLCVLYGIDFRQFLRTAGLPLDQAGRDPIPDELVLRQAPSRSQDLRVASEEVTFEESGGLLGSVIKQWEEVPLFLRHSFSDLTGLKNFSLSDVFWVGGNETPIHPWLINATFVVVNRRIKKPVRCITTDAREQLLYLILKRDGSYLCGPCALHQGNLVVHTYPGGPLGPRQFKNGIDAEIIGQVTTIVRRLPVTD
ncbi:MAG: hypothetical protein ACYDCE_07895 [Candidatus Acidiferrales bacterium]